ncbi:hypothetical protein FXO37_04793 [Capsicum annuum]|nr:hypothetical protein FXO37_04793 [Capsicum annuum]
MINKAMKIINEWKYFYMRGGNLRDLFFPSLITMMLKGIDVPKEGGDYLEESNVPFNQLKVKGSQGRSKKKRKIGLGAEIAGSKRERSLVPLVSRPLYPFGTWTQQHCYYVDLLGAVPLAFPKFVSFELYSSTRSNSSICRLQRELD